MQLLAQEETAATLKFTLAPLLEEHGIPLAIMGMLVVFSALSLLALFITLLPKALAAWMAHSHSASARSDPWIEAAQDELSEETLAVIAAAVAETIRQPHRILSVRASIAGHFEWSIEGRMQHHHSHKITRRH